MATATVRALPYYAWANRAGLGMRIWLPTRPEMADGQAANGRPRDGRPDGSGE